MADEPSRRPLLNPVLRFKKEARPEGITGRGKSRTGIKFDRLDQQRAALAGQFVSLSRQREQLMGAGGRVMLYASMFEDSRATTWTPTDIFQTERGASIVVPYRSGYLVEVDMNRFDYFASLMVAAENDRDMVDISRVEAVRAYASTDASRGLEPEALWELAPETNGGRAFTIWLMPYDNGIAVEAVLQDVARMRSEQLVLPLPASPLLLPPASADQSLQMTRMVTALGDRLGTLMREYRAKHRAKAVIVVPNEAGVAQLLASGSVFRLDPVRQITSTAPGEGTEPQRPLPATLGSMPIVGVVDGGLVASSYKSAEAWQAAPLVPGAFADVAHGNKVSSLVVQGHDWNNNLQLPQLYCRVGTVQAVPKEGSSFFMDPLSLAPYLDVIMAAHPETKVWNFSLNQRIDCDLNAVSALGHDLAMLARKHGILPIISIGNKPGGRMQPPADCEAALTVGGRLHDNDGAPGANCPVSLSGPGPSSMLKPDLAHFSQVRAIGGDVISGSSFSAALTSPLAAHTMASLREPSPDLVKALLLHQADGASYDTSVGFGSPSATLPWHCPPGAVTLQWKASLKAGAAYYWELPIPQAIRSTGKLRGYGVLTAILNPHPLVSDYAGPNYFSARLATAVQFERNGKTQNLLGSLDTKKITEQEARANDHKWSPVRHHRRKFDGIAFDGDSLNIYARIYTRDLYLYGYAHPDETPEMDVVFVLTIGSGVEQDDVYNQMHNALGTFVENSTIETDIEIEHS